MVEATLETRTETTEPLPLAEQIQDTRKTVLLVEDWEHYRGELVGILTGLGYRVLTADNFEDAYKILKKERIDYASLDLQIPWTGNTNIKPEKITWHYGRILAREIKKMYPDAKVIGLTMESLDNLNGDYDLRLSKEDGLDKYIEFFLNNSEKYKA